ncbi:MAG: multiprotein bridging factor aMBF1 [archaeon]
MGCEMCGKNTRLIDVIVEGTILSVCDNCSKYGETIALKRESSNSQIKQNISFKQKRPVFVNQETETLVPEYHIKIRRARERRDLKQEQVAKALAEKESVIQKVESGSLEPPLKLARKFEQFFNIKLIEKNETSETPETKEFNLKDNGVTIGDILKLKKG